MRVIDGFYIGVPLTLSKLLMRWSDEEFMSGARFSDYEQVVGACFTRYGIATMHHGRKGARLNSETHRTARAVIRA